MRIKDRLLAPYFLKKVFVAVRMTVTEIGQGARLSLHTFFSSPVGSFCGANFCLYFMKTAFACSFPRKTGFVLIRIVFCPAQFSAEDSEPG